MEIGSVIDHLKLNRILVVSAMMVGEVPIAQRLTATLILHLSRVQMEKLNAFTGLLV